MALTSGNLEQLRQRARTKVEIEDPTICYHCKNEGLKLDEKFCSNCGFPQRGTHDEQKSFVIGYQLEKETMVDMKEKIVRARSILLFLGAINFIIGLALGIMQGNYLVIVIQTIISIIYIGLAIWSNKNPIPAFLTGFIFYITMLVMLALINPSTLTQGIIWHLIVIGSFIYGLKNVKEYKDLYHKLEFVRKDSKPISYD